MAIISITIKPAIVVDANDAGNAFAPPVGEEAVAGTLVPGLLEVVASQDLATSLVAVAQVASVGEG
jgi:hypothetical protein